MQEKQPQQKADHDQHARARYFSVGDPVMMKNFRPGSAWLPGTIASKLGPLSYLVETADNQLARRHIDHLKSLVVEPESSTATTESEGSPEHEVGTEAVSSESLQPSL